MKKILVLFFVIFSVTLFAQVPSSKARGVFIALGVGPRLPVNYFANSTDLGYGLNFEISYTDNEYLPAFVFARIGYEQYPGSQQFYQTTQYSNFSTTAIPINAGLRYYFSPLIEKIVLFMPIVEVSANFTYYQKLHQFKYTSGRSNYTEENSKIGISAGVGVSMFMMEILASYNYNKTNQYLGLDLKIRLPLYITF